MGLGARRPRPFALAAAVLALVSMACTAPPPEQRSEGSIPVPGPTGSPTGEPVTSLRLSTLEPDSLDPQAIDAPQELLLVSQLFDGLVAYDPTTSKVTPAVAARWNFEQGGQLFVFRLRKGIRYHDGTPVTARDFVFAWSRLADPIASAPFSFLLERVEGYDAYQRRPVSQLGGLSAPDDRTLEVRLSSPWPDFVSLLGHPALSPVPPSASQSTFAAEPAGNGPFRIASPLATGVPLVLERFERYYGGRPAVDRLEFEVVEEAEDSWPDFLAGELDQATIPASALTVAQSQFGTAGVAPLGRLLYCAFNQASERLRDGNLRLAASLALERQQVASRVYGGLVTPATGLVPPPLPGAPADACGARCRRNLEEASRLVREVPRSSRTFALDYTRSSVGDALARTLAAQLEQAGLRVQPRPHTEPEYAELLQTGRQQFFCLVWTADYPRQQAVLEPLLGGGSPDNYAGFDDEKLNDLLGRARTERASAKRQGLYRRIEDLALERMHLMPVVWFRSHLAVQRYVEGLAVDPLGLFDASTLRIAR